MNLILKIIFSFILLVNSLISTAQILPLDTVLLRIQKNNLSLKTYNSKINALNAYAQGAKSWESPLVGPGFWMTPYDKPGNGSLMISIEQMIPNPKSLEAKKNI